MIAGAIGAAAPAKINLALHVCGKREDGYHLLDSLVVFAGVGDRISVVPSPELRLILNGPFGAALKSEDDNLVLRAARLLATVHGRDANVEITLTKNLPVASGIGGGSADAAATLGACARLWNVDLAQLPHAEIAARLGADVPVCVEGVPAFMSGIGEVIAHAPPLPLAWLLLVNPGVPLATRAVFEALRGRFSAPMPRHGFVDLANAEALAKMLKLYTNDLMAPAVELRPVIGDVLKTLEAPGDCLLARLSGSGPTCFGLYAGEPQARAAAQTISAQQPGWWVAPAPLLRENGAIL